MCVRNRWIPYPLDALAANIAGAALPQLQSSLIVASILLNIFKLIDKWK